MDKHRKSNQKGILSSIFNIFNDRFASIELCINRFDDHVKDTFIELYEKISADEKKETAPKAKKEKDSNTVRFIRASPTIKTRHRRKPKPKRRIQERQTSISLAEVRT